VLPLPAAARFLISRITRAWSSGKVKPDALAALRRYPELWDLEGAVADLALEEYHLARQAGQCPDVPAFCARFKPYHAIIGKMIAAYQFLEPHVEMLDEAFWTDLGEQVGGFRLLRLLGKGNLSRIYLATEPRAGNRIVVLKLSTALSQEACTLGPLDHPNIVPLLSTEQFEKPRLTVVCMPFRGTATLEDLINQAYPRYDSPVPRQAAVILHTARPRWPASDLAVPECPPDPLLLDGSYLDGVLHLGAQIAEALAHVHARGISHRDLKPSNVLLSPDGRPLLMDFNLSATPQALQVSIGGTLAYMAPEQIRASRDADPDVPLDGRVDLFALGVLLYELLTGQRPFGEAPAGMTGSQLVDWTLERLERQERVPLRRLNPEVSRRVARLIERCLAFDPADRPASAAEMAAALRGYFKPSARHYRWAIRHAAALTSVAGVLLLSTAATAWGLAQREPVAVRACRQAEAALAEGDAATAVEHFSQALEADPSRAEIWLCRGQARLRGSESPSASAATLVEAALVDFRQAKQLEEATAGPARAALHQRGRAAYQNHDYALAEQCYTGALECDGLAATVWFDRGRARLKQAEAAPDREAPRKWSEALNDFREAYRLQPQDAATWACEAYCLSRLEYHEAALQRYGEALSAGFPVARLLTNRAQCWLRSAQRHDSLDGNGLARADLDRARTQDPKLRAAACGRGTLLLKQWLARNRKGPLDALAVSDLKQASDQGPPNGELYAMTALATAAAAGEASLAAWDQGKQQTLDYLRRAIAHGKDPQRLARDPTLQSLISIEEFATLAQHQTPEKPSSLERLLWVDPIDE
jgi:serine/threonine protein kinase